MKKSVFCLVLIVVFLLLSGFSVAAGDFLMRTTIEEDLAGEFDSVEDENVIERNRFTSALALVAAGCVLAGILVLIMKQNKKRRK